MMESVTSFRFESHMIMAFCDEGYGDDVQRKFEKREKKEMVEKQKINLVFATLSLYF